MDYISSGDKFLAIFSQSDCLRLTEFGFECFDIFLTKDEWNHIADLPVEGHSFFHSDPTAPQLMKYAIESSEPFDQVYKNLNTLRFVYEQRMIENDWPFPEDRI